MDVGEFILGVGVLAVVIGGGYLVYTQVIVPRTEAAAVGANDPRLLALDRDSAAAGAQARNATVADFNSVVDTLTRATTAITGAVRAGQNSGGSVTNVPSASQRGPLNLGHEDEHR